LSSGRLGVEENDGLMALKGFVDPGCYERHGEIMRW
jgi:hypothetical protein